MFESVYYWLPSSVVSVPELCEHVSRLNINVILLLVPMNSIRIVRRDLLVKCQAKYLMNLEAKGMIIPCPFDF